jgi:putative MATE family efflux protein
MTNAATQTTPPAPAMDARTRMLLEGPIVPTLLRLGAPNVLVMLSQAAVGLIETYFIGKLGTDALAGMALAFPVVMLMTMLSAGAMGGAIASAIARALGARRREDADALVMHAVVIGLGLGLLFTVTILSGGRWLYTAMGGTGGALSAALTYSNWVFAGATLIWLFNSLSAVVRGTGNMAVPAKITLVGTAILIPLSPLLIFGWGPVPALGIAGGAIALLLFYFAGTIALALYLWSPKSLLRPAVRHVVYRWRLFRDILRVGMVGALSTVATNATIAIAMAQVGGFGVAAIAGYGTASRLEYLLVPLVFGLGAPLIAMVGSCMGAGLRERALQATWIGAALAFFVTEAIGLWAAFFPHVWLTLFARDPAMLEVGSHYLQTVGPSYGFFGLGLILFFASQGAGQLLWPVLGNLTRLAIAALGGWLALKSGMGLTGVFSAQAVALVVYGLLITGAIAGGSWFGAIGWPTTTRALLRRMAPVTAPG